MGLCMFMEPKFGELLCCSLYHVQTCFRRSQSRLIKLYLPWSSMQPWRSSKVEERKGREEQSKGHKGGPQYQTSKTWNKQNSSINNSISSSPMRQARLKPIPSSSSTVPLELLSSPSRGLAPGTDSSQDLTNSNTQNQFRSFISDKIQTHVTKFGPLQKRDQSDNRIFSIPRPSTKQTFAGANRLEGPAKQSLQDILLFIRRLREGCVAADRKDDFVLDVYVLSTLLSIILGDNIQLNSSLPRLVGLIDLVEDTVFIGVEAGQDIRSIVLGKRSDTSIGMTKGCLHSLLLLWLCISGGETERLGGQQRKGRPGNSLEFHERKGNMNCSKEESIKLVEQINTALARDDVYQIRLILHKIQGSSLDLHPDRFWQFALLQRIVNEIRSRVWHTLKKSYMHLAIDPKLVGSDSPWPPLAALAGEENWLERMLLIDIEVMPLNDEEQEAMNRSDGKDPNQRSDIPDSWDESIDGLSSALQSTSLSSPASLIEIRVKRIAEAFNVFELPQTNPTEDEGLEAWRDRIVTQVGAPVLKLR